MPGYICPKLKTQIKPRCLDVFSLVNWPIKTYLAFFSHYSFWHNYLLKLFCTVSSLTDPVLVFSDLTTVSMPFHVVKKQELPRLSLSGWNVIVSNVGHRAWWKYRAFFLTVTHVHAHSTDTFFPSSSLDDLQANELGMMSAFYKYILTTMVRASHLVFTSIRKHSAVFYTPLLIHSCSINIHFFSS